jgi:hypothetical protein
MSQATSEHVGPSMTMMEPRALPTITAGHHHLGAVPRMPMPVRPRVTASSNGRKASSADPARRSNINNTSSSNNNTEEEDDPVLALNRRALELLRDGSYGPAAARLKHALHLTKVDVVARNRNRRAESGSDGGSSSMTRRPQDDDAIPRPPLVLLPYDVGQGWASSVGSYREPLAFQPVLRGMLLVEQESSSSSSSTTTATSTVAGDAPFRTSSSSPSPLPTVSAGPAAASCTASSSPLRSDDRHGRVVMALCYNLGMVYHLLALRLSQELQEDDEDQDQTQDDDETTATAAASAARHQVDACLRKALRFYDLVMATTTTVAVSPEEEEAEPHESLHHDIDILDDESDQLLRVAVLANAGHAHYCLREMDQVRQCADQLCLALLLSDDDKAQLVVDNADRAPVGAAWPRMMADGSDSDHEDRTRPSATSPDALSSSHSSTMASALRLPLALNVLLYSEVKHPAPSA